MLSGLGKANVIHFSKDQVSVFRGIPTSLVEDDVFFSIRTDKAFREALLQALGVTELTVGRLGIKREEDGYFFLPDESPVTIDSPRRRSLGEYLKLGPR